jgi:ferredoxin-thioredoxin reductase catalytic subunit
MIGVSLVVSTQQQATACLTARLHRVIRVQRCGYNKQSTATMRSVAVFLLCNIVVSCALSIRPYPATRATATHRPRVALFSVTETADDEKPRQNSSSSAPTSTSASSAEEKKAKDDVALEKATKAMTAFTNKYLANTGTTLCADKSVAAVVIKGLAEHKVALGTPLCPCRFYDDKVAEAKDGFWNCPCVPMRERHECHCMLFLTEDNAFAGEETTIAYDEVVALISKDIV